MKYEYKMKQIPPGILLSNRREKGDEAASYIEGIANEWASEGWEFYRVDSMAVAVPTGCLGIGKPESSNYYVITFRREVHN